MWRSMRTPRPNNGLPAYSVVGTVITSGFFTLYFFSLFGGRVRERDGGTARKEREEEGMLTMSVELVAHGHLSDLILCSCRCSIPCSGSMAGHAE